MSDSLQPHEWHDTRPPCHTPTPGVHSDSRPFSNLMLCHPLLLLPPISHSIRVFPNESTLRMRWPKYRSFSFSIIPSKETSGLISFRMDWLDLCAVQGTLKSLLQHHSSKASILQHSAFFTVQNGLVGSPCSPRDSQESSPTPQFKSINSSALSLLHSPNLTYIHDHRKNHSLD